MKILKCTLLLVCILLVSTNIVYAYDNNVLDSYKHISIETKINEILSGYQ